MIVTPRGALSALALAFALIVPRASHAQTEAELNTARRVFAEALSDEGEKKFESAIEKYRRVQAVKDTANVRYRIAVCIDGLGHPSEALAAYEDAVTFGESDPANAEVVGTAKTRATQLRGVVAELTIVAPPKLPATTAVTIDRTPIPFAKLAKPIVLDPGDHTVTAVADGYTSFHASIKLPQAGHASIELAMPEVPKASDQHAPKPEPASDGTGLRIGGIVALSAGVVAGATAIGITIDQLSKVSNFNALCPTGKSCAPSEKGTLLNLRSSANTEGVVAPIVGGAAIALAGAGLYMLLTSSRHEEPSRVTIRVEPILGPGVIGIGASGSL